MKQLDKRQTKANAVKMLASYKQLKRLAGEEFVSNVTATYSFEPRSFTGVVNKPLEKFIERQMIAEKMVQDIEDGINRVNDAYLRQILIMKYCKNYDSDIYIYMTLGYSETEFYRLWEQAIYHFADVYKSGALLVFEGNTKIDDWLLDLGEMCK